MPLKVIPLILAGILFFASGCGSPSIESAAESYLQEIQYFNVGNVCDFYSELYYAGETPDICRQGLTAEIGYQILTVGRSPFNTAEWLRNPDGSIVRHENLTYMIDCGGSLEAQTVIWALEDGRWKVDGIEPNDQYGVSGNQAPQCTSDEY